jgi:hypothetical protein
MSERTKYHTISRIQVIREKTFKYPLNNGNPPEKSEVVDRYV